MIKDLLLYVGIPVVVLIVLLAALATHQHVAPWSDTFPDYDDDDYDTDYDDPDYDDDSGPFPVDIILEQRIYPALAPDSLTAEAEYGPATEYTVEHVRKLRAMEADARAFMSRQDREVVNYLMDMAA